MIEERAFTDARHAILDDDRRFYIVVVLILRERIKLPFVVKEHKLLSERGGDGLPQKGKIRLQRAGLSRRIILSEGHKVDVFPVQEAGNVLRRAAEAVVGGKGEHQGAAVSQVGLGRQGGGGVASAGGEGVAKS